MVGSRVGVPRDLECAQRLGMQVGPVFEDPDFEALCAERLNQVNMATDVPLLESCNRGSGITMSVTSEDGREGLVQKYCKDKWVSAIVSRCGFVKLL